MLGAVTVATAACHAGHRRQAHRDGARGPRKRLMSVEHPSGEFTVALEMNAHHPDEVARASLLRTARLIMRGEVFIPDGIWTGES